MRRDKLDMFKKTIILPDCGEIRERLSKVDDVSSQMQDSICAFFSNKLGQELIAPDVVQILMRAINEHAKSIPPATVRLMYYSLIPGIIRAIVQDEEMVRESINFYDLYN
jgi:hypothetical protein